jgi:hypothetical protein
MRGPSTRACGKTLTEISSTIYLERENYDEAGDIFTAPKI